MKKNWLQFVTLCLCAVLLIVTISQSRRLAQYQQQMKSEINNLKETVENEIRDVSDRLEQELDAADRIVSQSSLKPTGMDYESKMLTADVSITLKKWHDDTKITVLATLGGKQTSLPATGDGAGSFVARLSIPPKDNPSVLLEAIITGGGLTKKETLITVGELAMLLPLQQNGSSWHGPDYRAGILSGEFSIMIKGQKGTPGTVNHPVFHVYKNGKLAQTLPAVSDSHTVSDNGAYYTVNTGDGEWSIACDASDVINIRFLCEDAYGLGYDFPFVSWVIQDDVSGNLTVTDTQAYSSGFNLYWPEE